jgi:hypothetical protein
MSDIFELIWRAVVELFRSRASLEAEILTLRHQINVLRRNSAKRPAFTNIDRLVFASLYRLVPRVVNARSAKPFCQGDAGAIGLSRMAMARIRLVTMVP